VPVIDDLRAELLSAGKVQLEATFTLAIDKAREKMEKFQLPDPRYYVLQLMQAIIASGATKVEVEHRTELASYHLILAFDGPGWTKAELERLYDFIFESGRDRARDRTRELALGIVSAQALHPQEIRLVTGGCTWTREGQRPPRLTEGATSPSNVFAIRGLGAGREAHILETHCHHCDIEVRLNGKLVSSGKDLSGAVPWPNYRFTRGDLRGALGLGYGELTQSSLFLLRYGVQFTRRWEPRVQPPVVMICEHPGLRKNASQSDVVEDAFYLEFVEQLQQVLLDFALELTRGRIPPYHREVVQKFLVQFFGDWFSAPMLFAREEALPDDLRKLMGVNLFIDLRGKLRSLRELVETYREDGFLALCKRRMPYAKTGNLLVLVPTPDELDVLTRLFENVRYVDEQLTGVGGGVRTLSPGGTEPSRLLAQKTAAPAPGTGHRVLGIPDAYPRRACTWFCKKGGGWESATFEFRGLSAEVRFESEVPVEQRELMARIVLEAEAPALYQHLLDRLLKANRKPEHAPTIFRAREHLLAWWRSLIERSLEGRHTEDPARRAQWCREALGERAWNARLFDTRSGDPASIADMQTWLETFESLTVAFGGPRFQNDYALDASPDTVDFLALIFGAERLNQATLRANQLHRRQQQQQLAGAADGPPLVKLVEETEEEELARLRREMQGEVSAQAQPESEPEPEPLRPEEPAVESVPEILEVPEEVVPEAPPSRRDEVWGAFVKLHKLVFHAFNQGGVAGTLAICRPSRSKEGPVFFFRDEEELWSGRLFGLSLFGWLDLEAGGAELGPERTEIVAEHCHHLFERLAVFAGTVAPGHRDYAVVRQALLEYLSWAPERTRERLLLPGGDALVRLRFLPAAGGTLASLESLFEVVRALGLLEISWAGDPDPQRDYPVPIVDDLIPESFYRSLLRCDTRRAVPKGKQAAPELLLANLRKELRNLRGRGDFQLNDMMLANLYWGGPGNYFIQHDPESSSTVINPKHRVVKRVLAQMEKDPAVVPVLASSVYTALNRALEEIGDEHEIAFLEALLERE